MFKKINLFIVAVALAGFVAQSAQAVIVRGTIWRKQREDGTHQMVYCLSDYHHSRMEEGKELMLSAITSQYGYVYGLVIKYTAGTMIDGLDKVDQEQKKQLYKALGVLVKDEIMVLVEDMGSDTKGHSIICPERLKVRDFLNEIAQGCIDRKVPVINLECRQCYSMRKAYLDWLKITDQQLEQLGINQSMLNHFNYSMSDIVEESNKSTQEIMSYMNGSFLQLYSGKEIKNFFVLKLKFLDDCIENNYYDLDKAPLLDAPLLDLKAINYIHALSEKHIVVAMGAAHIKKIEGVLPALGYERICEDGCYISPSERFSDKTVDLTNRLLTLKNIINHGRTFNIARFIGSTQLQCALDEVLIGIKPKQVNFLDPDKLLVSMVYNNATRFPFCLLLPKVAKYLTEEEQLKRELTVDNSLSI